MRLPSDEVRVKGDLARELSKLRDHPSWETLRSEYEKVRREEEERLLRKLTASGINAAPIDQREIDYRRGFWAGAQWLLDNPDLADAALAAALKRTR